MRRGNYPLFLFCVYIFRWKLCTLVDFYIFALVLLEYMLW